MNAQFKEFYQATLRAKLKNELEVSNLCEVPRLEKIVINAGLKGVSQDSKLSNYVFDGINAIAGQLPVKTKAKKSIAGFKIREGLAIGCKVTLRRESMYNFLEKLIRVVIPAIRDFRGLSAKFDKQGNYNLGIKDWSVFPEIDFDRFPTLHGLNITFHISNGGDRESYSLLKGFGMPFIVRVK